jgi:hypothetical protein
MDAFSLTGISADAVVDMAVLVFLDRIDMDLSSI